MLGEIDRVDDVNQQVHVRWDDGNPNGRRSWLAMGDESVTVVRRRSPTRAERKGRVAPNVPWTPSTPTAPPAPDRAYLNY